MWAQRKGLVVMKPFKPLENSDAILPILSRIAIWGGASDEECAKIFKRLETGAFESGEYIYRKGDHPTYIYIVKSGKIGIFVSERDTVVEKETLTTGSCFGVGALMALETQMVSAIALENSEILALSRQSLFELRHEDIHLFALLMMNIAREIARKLKTSDMLLLHYAGAYKGI